MNEIEKRMNVLESRIEALESKSAMSTASAAARLGMIKSEKKAAASRANGARRWADHIKKELREK